MTIFLKLFGIGFIVFFVIDIIWLALIARKLYQDQIGFLLKTNVNWVAAILFYVLFIVRLVVFVIMPSVESLSLGKAMLLGALLRIRNLALSQ